MRETFTCNQETCCLGILKLKTSVWLALLLFLLISISPVLGHTPLQPDDNKSLDTPMVISDPTKSWAIYTELHEKEEAQYYILHLEEGERLKASLYVPIAEKGFIPKLVVLGSEISSNDVLPGFIEAPNGVGFLVVESNLPESPKYEPFTPSSYYYLSEFDLEISEYGDYYLVVYETSRGGRYGLAVGYREVFGIGEWLLIPIDVLGIREWEGQFIGLVLSHRIAGPIMRIKKFLTRLNEGHFESELKLRDKDELGDVADSLNLLVLRMREERYRRNELLDSLEREAESLKETIAGGEYSRDEVGMRIEAITEQLKDLRGQVS